GAEKDLVGRADDHLGTLLVRQAATASLRIVRLQERQNVKPPAGFLVRAQMGNAGRGERHPPGGLPARWEIIQGVDVVEEGEPDLLQVILAGCDVRRLAGLLDRRQQQADEHADNGDDHQQLGEGKPRAFPARTRTRRRHGWTSTTTYGSETITTKL